MLSSSFVRLCWRRMLQAKCSPALWVTESKEAQQQHQGFDVFLPFVSQTVLEQCRSAGGWLGGLLEQLIPDNVHSSRLWITCYAGLRGATTTSDLPFVLAFALLSTEEEFIVLHVFLWGGNYIIEWVTGEAKRAAVVPGWIKSTEVQREKQEEVAELFVSSC